MSRGQPAGELRRWKWEKSKEDKNFDEDPLFIICVARGHCCEKSVIPRVSNGRK
jgi:hypothetical protein